MFTRLVLVLVSMSFLFLSQGCKKKLEKGDNVKANLVMANGTSLTRTAADCPEEFDACYTPVSYGLKILNAIVSPDEEGATSAPAGLIWLNPDCPSSSSTSEVDDKEYSYNSMGDCGDDDVGDYFELARGSEEVNEDLNSQDYKILPGTYNYVQLAFCIGGAKSKNAEFQTEDMDEPYQVTSGTCGISSVKADPAIEVSEGDSISIVLTYDLANIIYQGGDDADEDLCYDTGEGDSRCFGYPSDMSVQFGEQE